MKRSIRLSCLLATFLFIASHGALAATYVVDVAGTTTPTWTVKGTIEFDGSTYSNWNLVSDSPTYGQFVYTPLNSTLAGSSPFSQSTNLGAQNFALDTADAGPDGGFLWLRFESPLTGLVLDETTVVPGYIWNGSADSRYDANTKNWFYNGMQGVIVTEAAVPNEIVTWGHVKAMY